MTCLEVQELLSAYIDNQLDEDKMKEIQEHLENCSHCSEEVQELKMIIDELSSLEDVPVPEAFNKKLHEALVVEGQNIRKSKVISLDKRKWTNWKRISSIAAVFLVGLFSVLLYNNNLDEFNKKDLSNSYVVEKSTPSQEDSQLNDKIEDQNTEKETDTEKRSENKSRTSAGEQSPVQQSNSKQAEKELRSVPEQAEMPDNQPSMTYKSIDETDKLRSIIVQNDNAELNSYLEQLSEILTDSDYEVNSCTLNDDENMWIIEVTIITKDSDGKEVKEDAVYYGQDGKLWKKEL